MTRRGPAPTPEAKLRLAGSRRAGQCKNAPQPKQSDLQPPEWINDDAKAVWAELAPKLKASGCMTELDENAITRYCVDWVRWKQAILFIEKHGETFPIKDDKGKLKYLQQLPQVAIASKLAQSLMRLDQEFGMTPSSRTRIGVEIKPEPNEKSRFFAS